MGPSHQLTQWMVSKFSISPWKEWTMTASHRAWPFVWQTLMTTEEFLSRNSWLLMKQAKKTWMQCKPHLTIQTPTLMMNSPSTNSRLSSLLLTHTMKTKTTTTMTMMTWAMSMMTMNPQACPTWPSLSTALERLNISKWHLTKWAKNSP